MGLTRLVDLKFVSHQYYESKLKTRQLSDMHLHRGTRRSNRHAKRPHHTQGLSLQHLYATTAKQHTNSSAACQRSINYPVLESEIFHVVWRQKLIGLRHNTLLGLCGSAAHGPAVRVTWQADHAGTGQAEQSWVQGMRTPACNHCCHIVWVVLGLLFMLSGCYTGSIMGHWARALLCAEIIPCMSLGRCVQNGHHGRWQCLAGGTA